MLKVGIAQILGGGLLYPTGIQSFFEAQQVDGRFLFWPLHLNDGLWDEFIKQNIGESFEYPFKWDKDIYGNNIAVPKKWDYNQIRVIPDVTQPSSFSWYPSMVKEHVGLITEWIGRCDFVLIDLSECIRQNVDRIWDPIYELIGNIDKDKACVFVYDHLHLLYADEECCLARKIIEWEEQLRRLNNNCKIVYVKSALFEKVAPGQFEVAYLEELLRDYNDKLQEVLVMATDQLKGK